MNKISSIVEMTSEHTGVQWTFSRIYEWSEVGEQWTNPLIGNNNVATSSSDDKELNFKSRSAEKEELYIIKFHIILFDLYS